MIFRLPRLQQGLAIVDNRGRPTTFFQRLFNSANEATEEAVTANAETLAALQVAFAAIQANTQSAQAAAEAANNAQTAADAGGGTPGAVSGSDTQSATLTTTPQIICTVNLAGVIAGNLSLSGSGLLQTGSVIVGQDALGTINIIEDDGITQEVVFSTGFTVVSGSPGLVFANSAAPSNLSRSSTGSITYLLEAFIDTGSIDLGFYLYARRS